MLKKIILFTAILLSACSQAKTISPCQLFATISASGNMSISQLRNFMQGVSVNKESNNVFDFIFNNGDTITLVVDSKMNIVRKYANFTCE